MNNHRSNDGLLTVTDVILADSCSFVTTLDLFGMLRCVFDENINCYYDEFVAVMKSFVKQYQLWPSAAVVLNDRYFGRLWMRLNRCDFYERVLPTILFFPLVTVHNARFCGSEIPITSACLSIVLAYVSNDLLTSDMREWRDVANSCKRLFHLCMDARCVALAVPFSLFENRDIVYSRCANLSEMLELKNDRGCFSGHFLTLSPEDLVNSRTLEFMVRCRKDDMGTYDESRLDYDIRRVDHVAEEFAKNLFGNSLVNSSLRKILFVYGISYFADSLNRNVPYSMSRTIHSYLYGLTWRYGLLLQMGSRTD